MRLRDYLVTVSDEHEPVGLKNRALRRVAARVGASTHTIYSISIGRRHASPEMAARIRKACDNHVDVKSMIKHEKKRPGPKVGYRQARAAEADKNKESTQ